MMLFTKTDIKQDTLQLHHITTKKASIQRESGSPKALKIVINSKDTADTTNSVHADTTSVCTRNSIADVTYYDSASAVFISKVSPLNRFPFIFTEKNREIQAELRATMVKHLKEGEEIPHRSSGDWMTGLLLLAAILYALVSAFSKNPLSGVTRFFLFRGINDPSSRDIGGLFHWQSTVLNFISFLVISLFAYSVLNYNDLLPEKIPAILFWLIILAAIILAVTLRHIISLIIGNISEQKDAFSEYLLAVYQAYRFSALFLFIIIIMVSFTSVFEASTLYISAFTVIGIMYLIRFTRLLIIFLNRKISIFYLILYLCALEILPVLITVKYFTGVI